MLKSKTGKERIKYHIKSYSIHTFYQKDETNLAANVREWKAEIGFIAHGEKVVDDVAYRLGRMNFLRVFEIWLISYNQGHRYLSLTSTLDSKLRLGFWPEKSKLANSAKKEK